MSQVISRRNQQQMETREAKRILAAFQRLMQEQNLSSKAESRKMLTNGTNKTAGELIPPDLEPLSPKEKAEALVHQASEIGPGPGRELIEEALDIDPQCLPAYEMLGEFEQGPRIANIFYEKAIALGREQFGGDFLSNHKGHFWMVHETRPFMRCLAESAECLAATGRKAEAIAIYREMLELNPNDNQGIRELLSLYLAEAADYAAMDELHGQYPDDNSLGLVYNCVLAAFKQQGASNEALARLKEAKARNPHVIKQLKAKTQPMDRPGMYTVGSSQEATEYVVHAWEIWQETPGAIGFLSQARHAGKKK